MGILPQGTFPHTYHTSCCHDKPAAVLPVLSPSLFLMVKLLFGIHLYSPPGVSIPSPVADELGRITRTLNTMDHG